MSLVLSHARTGPCSHVDRRALVDIPQRFAKSPLRNYKIHGTSSHFPVHAVDPGARVTQAMRLQVVRRVHEVHCGLVQGQPAAVQALLKLRRVARREA